MNKSLFNQCMLDKLAANGFELIGTGGGCTAYQKLLTHEVYTGHPVEFEVLVTDDNAGVAFHEGLIAGIYVDGDMVDHTVFDVCSESLRMDALTDITRFMDWTISEVMTSYCEKHPPERDFAGEVAAILDAADLKLQGGDNLYFLSSVLHSVAAKIRNYGG